MVGIEEITRGGIDCPVYNSPFPKMRQSQGLELVPVPARQGRAVFFLFLKMRRCLPQPEAFLSKI
jgi:hypothetical protein